MFRYRSKEGPSEASSLLVIDMDNIATSPWLATRSTNYPHSRALQSLFTLHARRKWHQQGEADYRVRVRVNTGVMTVMTVVCVHQFADCTV